MADEILDFLLTFARFCTKGWRHCWLIMNYLGNQATTKNTIFSSFMFQINYAVLSWHSTLNTSRHHWPSLNSLMIDFHRLQSRRKVCCQSTAICLLLVC